MKTKKTMKYYRADNTDPSVVKEVSFEEAYRILCSCWKDNKYTKSMLSIPNVITCQYSRITVVAVDEAGHRWCSMPGLTNLMPDEMYTEYEKEFGTV